MISRTQPRTTGSVGHRRVGGTPALDLQEREGDGGEDDVVLPAIIRAAFEVGEADDLSRIRYTDREMTSVR